MKIIDFNRLINFGGLSNIFQKKNFKLCFKSMNNYHKDNRHYYNHKII